MYVRSRLLRVRPRLFRLLMLLLRQRPPSPCFFYLAAEQHCARSALGMTAAAGSWNRSWWGAARCRAATSKRFYGASLQLPCLFACFVLCLSWETGAKRYASAAPLVDKLVADGVLESCVSGTAGCVAGFKSASEQENVAYFSTDATGDFDGSLEWIGALGGNPNLLAIQFQGNKLTGSLPTSVGLLGTLTTLQLNHNLLTGSLPSELGNLLQLETLWVASNDMTGSLPRSLVSLTNMGFLRVDGNSFNGTIPAGMAQFTKLQQLHMERNQFSKSLPDMFGNMQLLTLFRVYANKLTGVIPPSIGLAEKLRDLSLGANHAMRGGIPASFSALTKLQFLQIHFTNVSGPLPAFVGNYADLRQIVLGQSRFNGTIPAGLAQLEKLSYINFNGCLFSSVLPPALFNSTAMQFLWLTNNRLRGPIPSFDGLPHAVSIRLNRNSFNGGFPALSISLPKLTNLALERNQLDGALPCAALARMTKLTELWLGHNLFTGEVTAACLSSPGLKVLDVGANRLRGPFPSVSGLPELTRISIVNNSFNGLIPNGLLGLQKLTYVHLGRNKFTGRLPQGISWAAKPTLASLQLHANAFTGRLPPDMGLLSALTHLSLGLNQLTGSVPTSVGLLSKLVVLSFEACLLTGELPSELGLLKKLRQLHAPQNALTGPLPASLLQLDDLRSLDLTANELNRTIPSGIGQLKALTKLSLGLNQLTGSVPTSVGQLTGLRHLSLEENQLSQLIPSQIGLLNKLEVLSLRYNVFHGQIPASLDRLTNLEVLKVAPQFEAPVGPPLCVPSNYSGSACKDVSVSGCGLGSLLARVRLCGGVLSRPGSGSKAVEAPPPSPPDRIALLVIGASLGGILMLYLLLRVLRSKPDVVNVGEENMYPGPFFSELFHVGVLLLTLGDVATDVVMCAFIAAAAANGYPELAAWMYVALFSLIVPTIGGVFALLGQLQSKELQNVTVWFANNPIGGAVVLLVSAVHLSFTATISSGLLGLETFRAPLPGPIVQRLNQLGLVSCLLRNAPQLAIQAYASAHVGLFAGSPGLVACFALSALMLLFGLLRAINSQQAGGGLGYRSRNSAAAQCGASGGAGSSGSGSTAPMELVEASMRSFGTGGAAANAGRPSVFGGSVVSQPRMGDYRKKSQLGGTPSLHL